MKPIIKKACISLFILLLVASFHSISSSKETYLPLAEWDLEKSILFTEGSYPNVDSVDFSNDGLKMVVCANLRCYVYGVGPSWTKLRTIVETATIIEVDISQDNKYFAYGNGDGEVHVFWLSNYTEIPSSPIIDCSTTIGFSGLKFSDNSQYIGIGSNGPAPNCKLYIFYTSNWTQVSKSPISFPYSVSSIDWSDTYIAGGTDTGVRVFYVSNLTEISKGLLPGTADIRSIAFSNNGNWLVYGGQSGTWDVRIYNTATWTYQTLSEIFAYVHGISFSPDDSYLAYGGINTDAVRIVNVPSWAYVKTLSAASEDIQCVCFSPAGLYVAYGSNDDHLYIHGTQPWFPTAFTATPINQTRINLSWVKGSHADYTLVRYDETDYPNSISDGFLCCNITGESHSLDSLSPCSTYYFSAWSYNVTDGVWSTSYATSYATTESIIPLMPTDLIAETCNTSQINLSWVKGINAEYTYIRWDTSTYPTFFGGNLSCNVTGTSFEQTGLDGDNTYYFSAWSYNTVCGTWSSYATTYNTTDQIGIQSIEGKHRSYQYPKPQTKQSQPDYTPPGFPWMLFLIMLILLVSYVIYRGKQN